MIDLSHLNGFVDVSHFHKGTTQSVLQSLRVGDWMVSLDLQDAYLQVPVHPSSRRYLRFCVEGSIFQFRALCFGLSTAPQVFTRVMAPVSAIMHRHRFRILRYLYDWLVLASIFQEIVRARGFSSGCVNLPKSSFDPSRNQDYLGMTIQTFPLRVFPTLKRIQKLSLLLQDFLSTRVHPVAVWRQLLGVMSSISALVPGARLRMRSLQLRLNVSGSSSVGGGSVVLGRLLPPGSSVVVRRFSPVSRSASWGGSPRPVLVHKRFGHRLGCLSRGRPSLRLVVSPVLPIFHQSPGAPCSSVRDPRVPSFSPWSCGGGVLRQHHGPGVPQETGWHSIFHSQCGGSNGSPPVRGF